MTVYSGDILEIVVRYKWSGLYDLVNTFRFTYLHTSNRSDTQALADLKPWCDTLYGQLDDCITTNVLIAKPLLNQVAPFPRVIGEVATTARNGIRGSTPLPIGACSAITVYTGLPRRRGTYHFSGVSKDDNDTGVLSSAYMTELNQLGAALVFGFTDPVTGMNYRRILYDWRAGVWTTITAYQARPSIMYLRKRRPR